MNIKKIHQFVYVFALMLFITGCFITRASDKRLNENKFSLFLISVFTIVLLGAILNVVINKKLNIKNNKLYFILVGIVIAIISQIANFIPILGDILKWVQIISVLFGYLLIMLFIILMIIPKKSK